MITLPAVRFVRCYDPRECRIRNTWMRITTQDQLKNAPRATEFTVTAQSVKDALAEIRLHGWFSTDMETMKEIERSSRLLVNAQDSIYEVRA